MENHRGLPLNWTYFYQEKSMDELRQSLMLTMELEDTRAKAQEEIKVRDEQISQLKLLLTSAIKERDEAQEKCQKVYVEKILLQQQLQQQQQQQQQQHSGISSIDDDPKRGIDSNNGFSFSSSDCDDTSNIVVSSQQEEADHIVVDRPLPEKGKLLQAVMKAGPLLQTLLLAGPLPQWRHPPPPLDTYQIPPPPVVLPSPDHNISSRKRGHVLEECSSLEFKYQRLLLNP